MIRTGRSFITPTKLLGMTHPQRPFAVSANVVVGRGAVLTAAHWAAIRSRLQEAARASPSAPCATGEAKDLNSSSHLCALDT